MSTFTLCLQFKVLCTYQFTKFKYVDWCDVPNEVKSFVMDYIDQEGFYDNEWLAAHGHTPGELLDELPERERLVLVRKCKTDYKVKKLREEEAKNKKKRKKVARMLKKMKKELMLKKKKITKELQK